MANYTNFYSDDKHRYNFYANEDGTYDFMTIRGEKITLPRWEMKDLDLTPSITDLGKANKNFTDYLRLNFGDEILSEAVNILRRSDLFTWEYFPYETGFNYAISCAVALYLPYLVTHPIREFKGDGWERSVDKLCIAVFKNQTHEFWTGELLRRCLELKYPWMSKFDISKYSVSYTSDLNKYDSHLVFLTVKKQDKKYSIYIPLKALVEGDIEAIKKYHTHYFTEYYKWPGGWSKGVTEEDVMGWRKENIDVLESNTFKEFCAYITGKEVKKEKKTFRLPVTWEVCGFVYVTAETLEEAIEDFKENSDEFDLPDDPVYVEGTFELSTDDPEIIKCYQ